MLELHNYLPFLPKRMKIGKVEKHLASLYDKNEIKPSIRKLNQALNHRLILKSLNRVIKFNQKAWLKPYIDMNLEIRKKVKNDSGNYFSKLMNNVTFWKNHGKCEKT